MPRKMAVFLSLTDFSAMLTQALNLIEARVTHGDECLEPAYLVQHFSLMFASIILHLNIFRGIGT